MRSKPTFIHLAILLGLGISGWIGPPPKAEDNVGNFEVTLFVDGKKVSDTYINLSAGGTYIEIPASPVLSALASMVDQKTQNQLELQAASTGMLSNRVLSKFGISLSINGPLKRVTLSLMKKATPLPAAAKADTVLVPKSTTKEDSGPWASPPVPGLPGNIADSLDTVFSIHGKPDGEKGKVPINPLKPAKAPISPSDEDWGPAKPDSSAKVEGPRPPPPKPVIELETYRLDKTRDELFEEVFKKKAPPLPTSVEVTLLVDGKSYGTLWLLYNKEQKRYTFPVEPVLNALQGLVRPDLFEKLTQKAAGQSRLTVEDMIESGFPTVLNTSVFELSTGVPAQLMGTRSHSLSARKPDPSIVPAYPQSWLSAYLNLKLRQQYSYFQFNPTPLDSNGAGKRTVESQNEHPREPMAADLNGAVNFLGWVLEGRGNVWEDRQQNTVLTSRGDIRLVHDWPKRAIRMTAGDLIFPTSGFQSFIKIGGIGVSRDFSLAPHMVAYPVKELEFFLTNPSEVKVFVNGVLKATLLLDAGTHDLQGFPFTRGESEVEVQIRDDVGHTQTLNFSFIHETSLLAPGRSAFTYSIGLPSRKVSNSGQVEPNSAKPVILDYQYDAEHPLVFLDYRRGITDRFTLEGYTQAMDTAGMAGLNSIYALKVGRVAANVAGSYHQGARMGWAMNLEYTFIPKPVAMTSPFNWRIRGEYFDRHFFRPGQDTARLGAFSLASSIQKNSKLANVNLNTSYAFRPEKTDYYSVGVGINKNWKKGWSVSSVLRNTFDRLERTNTSISATANYYFFVDRQSLRASQRVENHVVTGSETGQIPKWDYTTDVAWDYNTSAPFPANPATTAAVTLGPISNEYATSMELKSGQGLAKALVRRTEPKASSVISNRMDLSLETSLLYVDGTVALSRPISNSFILVKGVENEKDCDILVNPSEVGYDAKGSRWLPGVIPYVNPYHLKKIHVEVVDPPFGSGDERTDFTLYPGYKSGYSISMGSGATIIALGTLLLAPGVPVEYQSFTATPIDGKARDPVMGFTNGAGKFQLARLQPGRYRIDLQADDKDFTLILTLPKAATGIKSVGTLILKQK